MRRGKALQRGMMILTAATLIAAGGAAYGQAAGHEPVRFAIIGDRTGNHQPGLYEQALAEIEWLKPELIITVGDHIEGYTEDTAQLNQEWQEYKLLVQGLDVPLYLTPGNHDVLNQTERDIYLRQIGKPNYSFDYKGIHFVVCDNAVWGKSS